MSELSDRELAVETNTTVRLMKEQLLGGQGIVGAIPEIKSDMKAHEQKDNDRFEALTIQQSYFRGGLAFAAFIVIAFTGLLVAFIEHVKSGK